MPTTTANLGLTKPTVGADSDQWGTQLNASLDVLDAKVLDRSAGGTVTGSLTTTGNIAVNGGSLTTTATTAALLNTGATTLNIGGAATALNLGAATGTATINNAAVSVKALTATSIGATTAGSGAFTTLSATGTTSLGATSATSINNTPIGATTANTGAFTSLSYTGSLTGGTGAINIGSGQLVKDTAGNLGLGVTPSAWGSNFRAIQFSFSGSVSGNTGFSAFVANNAYFDGSTYRYITSAANVGAQLFGLNPTGNGGYGWNTAPSGTAGAPITFTQAMTLTQGGNLLVGTTVDDGYRLDVRANTQFLGRFTLGQATAASEEVVFARCSSRNTNDLATYDLGGLSLVREDGAFGVRSSFRIVLKSGGGTGGQFEAARITSAGNLLVGTTTEIAGVRAYISGGKAILRNVGPSQGLLQFGTTDDTHYIGAGNDYVGMEINATGVGNEGIKFLTGTSGTGTERARITSGGYAKFSNTGTYPVGVVQGNAAGVNYHQFNSNQNLETLIVDNQNSGSGVVNVSSYVPSASTGFHFYGTTGSANVYRVLANGNIQNTNNSYGAISDLKLKENITDATPKLANLNKLRVVNYTLKADESKLKQIGLIAQEVEAIFPGLVESTPDTVEVTKTRTVEAPAVLDEEGNEVTPASTTEETYTEREPNGEVTKSVKYSVLVPMLLKAVQELSAQNATLEARLAALESK